MQFILTGLPVPESVILASAIIALFIFIGNYISRLFQNGIQSFLIEISKILIERVFVRISLNKTGPVMVLKIQMFCGLTGKRNFWISLILMHHFERDAREPIKHLGSIHN